MKKDRFRFDLFASWFGFFIIVVAWQLIATFELINPRLFPGPIQVVQTVIANLTPGRVFQHIGFSLMRVVLGFVIGGTAGMVVGIVSGWYVRLGSVLRTPVELLRPIPPLAWIPIAIIWLGLDEASKVFIISLGVFFPMFTNTYKGMISIDPNIIRAGQMLGMSGGKLLMRVVVPATLPDIATGMRLGWSYGFGSMVAAELLAAGSGLGYMIMHARELNMIGVIMFGILLIGAINLATDYLIQDVIMKRLLRWHYLSTT